MPDGSNRLSPSYVAVLFAAVVCYAALGAVLSILPVYVQDTLHSGPTAVGLTVGAPALTALLARPLGGRIADRGGPLMPLLTGAVLMAVGAVPAVVSQSLPALLLSRLAVGFGEGMMMSATVLWLLRLAGPERRGLALGHIGLANYAGLAVGPLIATAIGGAGASTAVLAAAVLLPLAGAAAALLAHRGGAREAAGPAHAPGERPHGPSTLDLLRVVAPAGAGLLLVNVGYVAVLSFGAAVARTQHTGLQTLIVPVFAVVIILTRTLGGTVPDRLGGRRTVIAFAGLEAAGLLLYANASAGLPAFVALLVLSIGQSLAVPGLGLLALSGVPAAQQGAAAGIFFAWFDAGVGLGGPSVGAVASLTDAGGALEAAGVAVAGAALIGAIVGRRRIRA